MNKESNDNPEGLQARQSERFDFLMTRYLAREASAGEEAELRQMTENGFEGRFRKWLDEEGATDEGTENLSGKARQDILTNILGPGERHVRQRPMWWSWAAAVLLAMGGVLWVTLRNQQPAPVAVSQAANTDENNAWQTVKGKQFLILPDGSRVMMNDNAELSYEPASFAGKTREVRLTGEAYFDVAHDAQRPFLVKTGAVVTRVLGTAFNVSTRKGEVVVTVMRGLVEVGGQNRVYAKIRPDEQITVNSETEQFQTESISAATETSWKNAYLVLDNVDLESAAKMIGEHYGVRLTFTNAGVKRCRITASFMNHEDLGTVLTVLTKLIGATFKIDGKNVTVDGGDCD